MITVRSTPNPVHPYTAPPDDGGWRYFPGQLDYLARVATKDYALVAADTGTGKSLMALSLIRLKLERDEPILGLPAIAPSSPVTLQLRGVATAVRRFKGRALIIAPQGTTRGDPDNEFGDNESDRAETKLAGASASQWRVEIQRFAPDLPVFDLFSLDDYRSLLERYGELPPGIYLSYYEAMFRNSARESLPESWDHDHVCQAYNPPPPPTHLEFKLDGRWFHQRAICATLDDQGKAEEYYLDPASLKVGDRLLWDSCTQRYRRAPNGDGMPIEEIKCLPSVDYSQGVGEERDGIRCILSPSLATIIEAESLRWLPSRTAVRLDHQPATPKPEDPSKSVWDLVALDEAHVACHLSAQVTQAILRLQPRYRYALTATPIPNIVSNLFSIMGWLCVPGWHLNGAGGIPARNAAWPYARDEIHRFNETFLSVERDYTQETINQERNHRWRGKCVKTSPVISSPARLLKLLKPTLAFISKEMCNPNVVPCKVIDIRVPVGRQQARLYRHFMDRGHICGANALVRARKQVAYLRGICADPANFEHGGPPVATNFNPKTVAVLELAASILQRGEQVVIVSARIGQTDEFCRRLIESIGRDRLARIDSTVPASHHNAESNRFKRGEARVMLMGIKCAKGYSYDLCPNLIVASLEYAYGSLHQAMGRVWRVASKYLVTTYCILHQDSIEETMFDIVATKKDAATICLHGERVPRDFHPVTLEEILASHLNQATQRPMTNSRDEAECESDWPRLRTQLEGSTVVAPWRLRVRAASQLRVTTQRGRFSDGTVSAVLRCATSCVE